MKQNTKVQLVLEDPKQAAIHLAFNLQLKGGWGYPKRCKKILYLKWLHSSSISKFLLYLYIKKNAVKNFDVVLLWSTLSYKNFYHLFGYPQSYFSFRVEIKWMAACLASSRPSWTLVLYLINQLFHHSFGTRLYGHNSIFLGLEKYLRLDGPFFAQTKWGQKISMLLRLSLGKAWEFV